MLKPKKGSGPKKQRTRGLTVPMSADTAKIDPRHDPDWNDGDPAVPFIKGMLLRGDPDEHIQRYFDFSSEELFMIVTRQIYRSVEPAAPHYLPMQYQPPTPLIDLGEVHLKLRRTQTAMEALRASLRDIEDELDALSQRS